MPNNIALDANNQSATGVYDPASHSLVVLQAGTVQTDPSTGVKYAAAATSSSGGGTVSVSNFPATQPVSGSVAVVATPGTTTSSATAAAAAACSATLAGQASKTTYLTGFTVTSGNATAAVVGTVTVTGTIGGSLNYVFVEPTATGGYLSVSFSQPIPASAQNTAITVTLAALTGGANSAVVVTGYVA
jgi:hypothetical protein